MILGPVPGIFQVYIFTSRSYLGMIMKYDKYETVYIQNTYVCIKTMLNQMWQATESLFASWCACISRVCFPIISISQLLSCTPRSRSQVIYHEWIHRSATFSCCWLGWCTLTFSNSPKNDYCWWLKSAPPEMSTKTLIETEKQTKKTTTILNWWEQPDFQKCHRPLCPIPFDSRLRYVKLYNHASRSAATWYNKSLEWRCSYAQCCNDDAW